MYKIPKLELACNHAMYPRTMGDGGKDYILSAAAICFADAWRLSDKLGKNLVGVHAPVANYPGIAKATSAFFRGLKVGNKKVRYTHTFCERPDLHIECEVNAMDVLSHSLVYHTQYMLDQNYRY